MHPHPCFQGIPPSISPSYSFPQSCALQPTSLAQMPLLSTYQSPLSFPYKCKKTTPSLHLKVVHTHWLKLFNFQLFRIVSFYKSLHYAPYFLQTLHNFCIISKLKSLQSPINTDFISLMTSSSGTITHP